MEENFNHYLLMGRSVRIWQRPPEAAVTVTKRRKSLASQSLVGYGRKSPCRNLTKLIDVVTILIPNRRYNARGTARTFLGSTNGITGDWSTASDFGGWTPAFINNRKQWQLTN
jgi:hypothetical protein